MPGADLDHSEARRRFNATLDRIDADERRDEVLRRGELERRRWALDALLREFHVKFGQPVGTVELHEVVSNDMAFRLRLITEELYELRLAVTDNDATATLDALADLTYVVFGTATVLGWDLDAAVREVHRSNMTKTPTFSSDPTYTDAAGKGAVKGPDYEPPNLAPLLGKRP